MLLTSDLKAEWQDTREVAVYIITTECQSETWNCLPIHKTLSHSTRQSIQVLNFLIYLYPLYVGEL